MGALLTDEALIDKIIQLRLDKPNLTAAETHKELVAVGYADLELSAVKKAAGKATKKAAKDAAAAPPAPAAKKADAAPAPLSEAKQAKQAKAQATELKSAENAMMDAHRRLRAAKSGGDMAAMAVSVDGSVEDFIQKITMLAMAGILEPGEERFLRERVEADIAALEWVRLAQKAGALSLTEDIVALGGELQLTRLKEVRGCRGEDLPKALACYNKQTPGDGSYQDVDKTLGKAGALAAAGIDGAGELEDID